MTLRFGNKIRLAPADRWRLMMLTEADDPGEITTVAALKLFLEFHRLRVWGNSNEAQFRRRRLRQEWQRLSPGVGFSVPKARAKRA